MGLPIDLEDIVGAVIADLIRRVVLLWLCFAVGWLLMLSAFVVVELGFDLWRGTSDWSGYGVDREELFLGLMVGGIAPVLSSWGFFYLVSLLAFLFWLFKSNAPSAWMLVVGAGIVGLFSILAHGDFEEPEGWITLGVWLGELGGLAFFVRLWCARVRKKAEEHFLAVAAENELRRRENEEANGGKVRAQPVEVERGQQVG